MSTQQSAVSRFANDQEAEELLKQATEHLEQKKSASVAAAPVAVVAPVVAPVVEAPVAPVTTSVVEEPKASVVEAAPAASTMTAAPATAAPTKVSFGRKSLRAAFNFAAGAGIAGVMKWGIAAAMVGTNPIGLALITGVAVGAAMTVYHHEKHRIQQETAGGTSLGGALKNAFNLENAKGYLTWQTAQTFAIGSVAATAGAMFTLLVVPSDWFQHNVVDTLKDLWHGAPAAAPVAVAAVPVDTTPVVATPPAAELALPPAELAPEVAATDFAPAAPAAEVAAAPVAAPVIDPTPIAPVCALPIDRFADHVQGLKISTGVTEAMTRSVSDNAVVAAQGTKDLAYYTYNGIGGVPKDAGLAASLFQQAADAGNIQAKTDLLYLQYHGLVPVVPNAQAAIDTMSTIKTPVAQNFVQEWSKLGSVVKSAGTFDSGTILKGAKLCP